MNLAIIYIGLAQSLFSAFLFLFKRPLRTADIILFVWMLAIASIFIGKLFNISLGGAEWEMILILWAIAFTFPPFVLLYPKYITSSQKHFRRTDVLHFIPFLIVIMLIVLLRNKEIIQILIPSFNVQPIKMVAFLMGYVYVLMTWIYGVIGIRIVIHFKKHVKDVYSYKSNQINLTWLILIIISFIIIVNVRILMSALYDLRITHLQLTESIRNSAMLIFVYILSIWGYWQKQLISFDDGIEPTNPTSIVVSYDEASKMPVSSKYQKSGLKSEVANDYLIILVQCMTENELWKDSELSVSKLSSQTNIPKHYITQVLNEYLGKNFYTFTNEYRVEYAKKLIESPRYQAWSFVAIAFECGFNSKTTFNIFFKKHVGLTPSEYRQSLIK